MIAAMTAAGGLAVEEETGTAVGEDTLSVPGVDWEASVSCEIRINEVVCGKPARWWLFVKCRGSGGNAFRWAVCDDCCQIIVARNVGPKEKSFLVGMPCHGLHYLQAVMDRWERM